MIENLALFEVSNTPLIPLFFKLSKIDPYYMRYKSTVNLELTSGEKLEGDAVLEIMDLK